MSCKPFTHQTKTLKFLKNKPSVFDASDPGTGKTFGQVMDFTHRRKKGGGKGLVLAPKSLLDAAWKNDFHKFSSEIRVSVAYANNREKAFKAEADIYITNIDAATWLLKQKPAFFRDFDTLIIDESTSLKHHTSARSQAIAKIVKYFKWRRLLSGTPNPNGILDLWHQYYLLDDGKRLGKSFFGFRAATCSPQQVSTNMHAIQWTDKPGIEGVVGALIRDITIRHVFEECVDIPENFKYAVPYTLSPKHRAAYKELEALSITQLNEMKTVTAINGAVLYSKLMQMASGAVYDDQGEYTLLDTGRYELVMDLVEERKHSIVFFNWEHQRDELLRLAESRGITYALIDGSVDSKEREHIVKAYQAGWYKVLFAHPQSAGHGLTLTRGTATIWASPTHNLEHFLQGSKRIYRISQTERTETIVIIAAGTTDEAVWTKLQDKDMKLTDLLKELKEP